MIDDTYCLFVILACMAALAVPTAGQVVVAAFSAVLAVLARLGPQHGNGGRSDNHWQHDIAGR